MSKQTQEQATFMIAPLQPPAGDQQRWIAEHTLCVLSQPDLTDSLAPPAWLAVCQISQRLSEQQNWEELTQAL